MPQFVMEGILEPDFQALDEFTQGYIQALFFTDNEPGTTADPKLVDAYHSLWDPETDSSLPGDVSFMDLDPESLRTAIDDCASFQARHATDLMHATKFRLHNGNLYGMEQAGMDFWYTRNRHGVGYWDRASLRSPQAIRETFDRLSESARAEGEVWTTYGDDGKVYIS